MHLGKSFPPLVLKCITVILNTGIHLTAGTPEIRGCVNNVDLVGLDEVQTGITHLLRWSDLHSLVTAVNCGGPVKACLLPDPFVMGLPSIRSWRWKGPLPVLRTISHKWFNAKGNQNAFYFLLQDCRPEIPISNFSLQRHWGSRSSINMCFAKEFAPTDTFFEPNEGLGLLIIHSVILRIVASVCSDPPRYRELEQFKEMAVTRAVPFRAGQ